MFAEQKPANVVLIDEILTIDKTDIQAHIDARHSHGFFNELYKLFADKVHFQLRNSVLTFEISLFGADAAASDSEMLFEFDAEEVREILVGYFSRHRDVFIQYFPEYEESLASVGKKVKAIFEGAVEELGEMEITEVRGLVTHELLDRLVGITPLLLQDAKSRKQLNEMFAYKKISAIHEYTHQVLYKLAEYYGLNFAQIEQSMLAVVFRHPDLKSLRMTLIQRNWNHYPKDDPEFLKELNVEYIKALIAKLSEPMPSMVSSSEKPLYSFDKIHNYLKHIYKSGVEEIVIRLLEAQIQNHTVDEALQHLDDDLFKTTGYYLKASGIIFPDQEEVKDMIQKMGIERAFHAILEKFYNDEAFEAVLQKITR